MPFASMRTEKLMANASRESYSVIPRKRRKFQQLSAGGCRRKSLRSVSVDFADFRDYCHLAWLPESPICKFLAWIGRAEN